MTTEERLRYIGELRYHATWIRKEWGVRRVPGHCRVAVMSYARHTATVRPVWEDE